MTKFLRSPDFGNSFRLVPNTIQHRTLNGNLRTYQGNRPTWEGFHVVFSALTRAQLDKFKAYVIASAGQVITLTDHEGRDWLGIISSRQILISAGKGECNYQAEFEFEGNVI